MSEECSQPESIRDTLRLGPERFVRAAEKAMREPRLLEIPGGWIEVPRDADEATLTEAAELFVRGQRIGARALLEEI